jgi:hypothetical protein
MKPSFNCFLHLHISGILEFHGWRLGHGEQDILEKDVELVAP